MSEVNSENPVILDPSVGTGGHGLAKANRLLLDMANDLCRKVEAGPLRLKIVRQVNWKVAAPAAKATSVQNGSVMLRLMPVYDTCFDVALIGSKNPVVLLSAITGRIEMLGTTPVRDKKKKAIDPDSPATKPEPSVFDLFAQLGKLKSALDSARSTETEIKSLDKQKRILIEQQSAITEEIFRVETRELELMQKLEDDPEVAKAKELAKLLAHLSS
jgi:hypothetical protein